MDRIDKYLNSIYRGASDSSKETEDLKQEMRNHLMQTVKELQENGVTEEESVKIAIERFGEVFQIRNELNHVLSFQKLFASKIRVSSLILLALSVLLLVTAFILNQGYIKRISTMNPQIELIETKLINEGIASVDIYLKEIFKDDKNNQLTYVALKELPPNFDSSKNNEPFSGEIKYSYPKKIESESYNNRSGHEVTVNNTKYLLETGVKTSANTDYSGFYLGLAILIFMICWVLWIIWSIINVYRYGRLNTKWCILLILTGIIGYFIFSIVVNPNNVKNNRKIKIIYIALFFLIVVLSVVFYFLHEPYRLKRLYQLIF
ncbi:permease prefix domain 1-containing protein [Clostridium estertheticum]|uniref:Uncharacterized protein n=1 Tax=Clostridium estertheticum subsp. estertheticum TaxID=1552 RepID=A0A1J0GEF6_9CLOT|nr:permease prefix domain 1-containing protein [Clostridium estertheticum]APC39294.1 hypothetical protein A7L45_04070 [Clostridium estertheticum subsp. estertheticum]MBU3171124.1 hypothetical protein [Clostridium estertheticum]MBZ9614701.1 permease prefix domain 1-containing protein [Clostridium estertheticum subsp. laramiense]WAG74623.1 permease prefix domain 1-containing protein [Clostridium estertheticum]